MEVTRRFSAIVFFDAGAAVHVGARFCDDDFMAGCAELGRQCLASFAESDNQDICGDGGGESGVGGHGMLPCVRCEQFAGATVFAVNGVPLCVG